MVLEFLTNNAFELVGVYKVMFQSFCVLHLYHARSSAAGMMACEHHIATANHLEHNTY